jgi:hypothetical protein
MKLVLLEALIVMIAMRAVLAVMGHAPPWPTPMWEFFAGLAVVSTVAIGIGALRERLARPRQVAPPHIPLERIGPFEPADVLVRFGARGERNIHLN